MTRPIGEGSDTADQINEHGWSPLIVHTVEINPRPIEQVSHDLLKEVSEGIPGWIVFMSPRGASIFFDAANRELKEKILEQSRILAVGPKTRNSLNEQGAKSVEVPNQYSSEGIAEFFSKRQTLGERIMLVRTNEANAVLKKSLQARGALVSTLPIYGSSLPTDETSVTKFLQKLKAGGIRATLFTSALSATNLFKISESHGEMVELRRLLMTSLIGAIGPPTWKRLVSLGLTPGVMPQRFLIEEGITRVIEAAEARTVPAF